MDNFTIWHWLIILTVAGLELIWVIPIVKILHKAGYSGWWCVLMLFPIANIVVLWVFAFARWPNLKPTVV
jgi:uncharacterized membrane protein YhaH (DUF805 family)